MLLHIKYAFPLQVCFSASIMLVHFKYASPLQVCFSASSALLCFKYASQLQERFSASSAILCFKYASPLQVRFSALGMLLRFNYLCFSASNMFFFNGDVEKRKFTSLFIPLIALSLNRSSTCRRKKYETSDSIFLTFKKYLSHFKNTEGRSRSSHLFKASLIFH